MITKELEIIKQMNDDAPISAITQKNIQEKELELGIALPEALCDLYMIIDPSDQIFSFNTSLIPFQNLRLIQIKDKYHIYTILPFFIIGDLTYGVLLRHESKDDGKITDYLDVESQRIAICKTHPKSKKEREIVYIDEFARLPNWILWHIGHLKLYTLQNIIALKSEMSPADLKSFWASFDALHGDRSKVFISKEHTGILAIYQLGLNALDNMPFYEYIFGANAEAVLKEMIAGNPEQYVWLKNAGSHQTITEKAVEKPSMSQQASRTFEFNAQPRALYSIEPILKVLSDFANLSGTCESQDSIAKYEKKYHISLPQPLKDYYCHLPKTLYTAYNTHTPLSRLRPDKFGKMKFLTEAEQIYSCAFEPKSPYVFFKMTGDKKWDVWGNLDGFLVGEFIWTLACSDEIDLAFVKCSNFTPSMLENDGILSAHLFDLVDGLSQKVSEGSFFRLYQNEDGQIMALYDSMTPSFWLISKKINSIKEFETHIGLSLGI